jgi:hypothetical protein
VCSKSGHFCSSPSRANKKTAFVVTVALENNVGEGQMDEILAKLERIQQLWKEQEKLKPGTSEHEALMKQIRALALEYQALVEAARKRDNRK